MFSLNSDKLFYFITIHLHVISLCKLTVSAWFNTFPMEGLTCKKSHSSFQPEQKRFSFTIPTFDLCLHVYKIWASPTPPQPSASMLASNKKNQYTHPALMSNPIIMHSTCNWKNNFRKKLIRIVVNHRMLKKIDIMQY